jgi:predicted ABC-type ATPase
VSRTFAHFLRDLKARGYGVAIYYFSLANASLAVRRVKLRVALGGHDVPSDVVKRRFGRSVHNFFDLYAPLASPWAVFDNSQSPHARLVATSEDDNLIIKETSTWLKLKKLANRA